MAAEVVAEVDVLKCLCRCEFATLPERLVAFLKDTDEVAPFDNGEF